LNECILNYPNLNISGFKEILARLYHVSLDELLRTEDEIPRMEEDEKESDWVQVSEGESGSENENEEYVHVGFHGIHV